MSVSHPGMREVLGDIFHETARLIVAGQVQL